MALTWAHSTMRITGLLGLLLLCCAWTASSEFKLPGSRHRRANAKGSKFRTVALSPATTPFNKLRDALPKARERALTAASLPAGAKTQGTLSHAPGHSGRYDRTRAAPEVGPAAYGNTGLTYADSAFNTYTGPSRSSGLLFMRFGDYQYPSTCSATLIGRSLLLTAAHCIFNFGANSDDGYAKEVWFAPAWKAAAPYGYWYAKKLMVPATYYDGTDSCESKSPGIVCNNDLALVWLDLGGHGSPQQAGDVVGYMEYGWNYYGFAASNPAFEPFAVLPVMAATTQLGYPFTFDYGDVMQVSQAPAFPYSTDQTSNGQRLTNVVRGTVMLPGSSGGPWIVNYGVDAVTYLSYGKDAARNVIMGVTSYGYLDDNLNFAGASAFGQNYEYPLPAYGERGAGNIGYLVHAACDDPDGWRLQEQGFCRPSSPCSTAPRVMEGSTTLDVPSTDHQLITACGRIYNANYYKFTPQESGPYVFSTCGGLTNFDTFIAVTTGCDTRSEILTCNDEGATCDQYGHSTTPPVALQASTTYYVVVGAYFGSSYGSATLSIEKVSPGGFITQDGCMLYSGDTYDIPACDDFNTFVDYEDWAITPGGKYIFNYPAGVCTSQNCAQNYLYTNSTIASVEDCVVQYDSNYDIMMFTYDGTACHFYGIQIWPVTQLALHRSPRARTKVSRGKTI